MALAGDAAPSRRAGVLSYRTEPHVLGAAAMYTPPHFTESRIPILHDLIRAHPLATIVTASASGLDANHVPLLVDPDGGASGVLLGHVARANPVWKGTPSGSEALVVFQGPDHYVSPNWYPGKRAHGKVVPTWNYAVVHVRGRVIWHEDAAWLRPLLERLTATHERTQPVPWTLADAPPDYIERMLAAVVGLEIPIASLTGKWKLSQNQSAADRSGVVAALQQETGDDAAQMAAGMHAGRDIDPRTPNG